MSKVRLNLLASRICFYSGSTIFTFLFQKFRGQDNTSLRFNISVSAFACRMSLTKRVPQLTTTNYSLGDASLLTSSFESVTSSGPYNYLVFRIISVTNRILLYLIEDSKIFLENYFWCHWCEATPHVFRTAGYQQPSERWVLSTSRTTPNV